MWRDPRTWAAVCFVLWLFSTFVEATTPELNTTTIYKQDRIASSSCTEGAGE